MLEPVGLEDEVLLPIELLLIKDATECVLNSRVSFPKRRNDGSIIDDEFSEKPVNVDTGLVLLDDPNTFLGSLPLERDEALVYDSGLLTLLLPPPTINFSG